MTNRLLLATVLFVAPGLAAAAEPAPATPPAQAPAAQKPPAAAAPAQAPAAQKPAPAAAEPAAIHAVVNGVKVPLFTPQSATVPVATIDGDEIITLADLEQSVASAHESHAGEKGGKKDFKQILDRIIAARLCVLEARDMGIDDLPEFKKAVDDYREKALDGMLKKHVMKDVKPDPAEVKQLYRTSVREWKTETLFFAREEEAKKLPALLKSSKKTFAEVAKQLVKEKKASKATDAEYLPASKMLPQVLAVVEKLPIGKPSAPIKVQGGYAILNVLEVRYPEDKKALAQAEAASLDSQRRKTLQAYFAALVKKQTKTDDKLFKKLDYEAPKPGLAALKKDERVIVKIEGQPPIRVSTLTAELEKSFHHGIEAPIKEKRVNAKKRQVLDALLVKALVRTEARRLGLQDTEEVKRNVRDHEFSLLFSAFLEKVVAPGVSVSEDDQKAYYAKHKAEFSSPAMYKLESIGFKDTKVAQSALDRLRQGTDLRWMKANADGQLREAEDTLHLEGNIVAATTMPKELSTVLTGAKIGDWRLYKAESGAYAVHVMDLTPSNQESYEEVKEKISQKLFPERFDAVLKSTVDKLRAGHQVKVFITQLGV